MGAVRILWIDLCRQPVTGGLAQLVPGHHEVRRIDGSASALEAVRDFRPKFACIEFDYPDRMRLGTLTSLRRVFSGLPLLMFTEYHSEALAVWAFRSGVWDYRVKPLDVQSFTRSIEVLVELVQPRPLGRTCERSLPSDLIEPAGHLRRPPATARKSGAAVAYIAVHFDQAVKRDMLARLCHLSRSEFSRVFRREQGMTFEHFLLEYRIAQARELLGEPSSTVAQAAYASGFRDPSYFSRTFHRLVGVTASEYRQRATARHIESFAPPGAQSSSDHAR